MTNKISVFLPTRKGSQRIKNKNTRPFASIEGGLLELKIRQLIEVDLVDEIILSTNDENSIKIANQFIKLGNKLKIIERPDYLASDSTNLTDLVNYVPSICNNDHILWTHVTSPFVEGKDYTYAIKTYFNELDAGFDSLMSVKSFRNFLWNRETRDIINRKNDEIKWPRTQDLAELYEVDSAIFINSRSNYLRNNDRVGTNPFLFIMEGIKSFDIDWNEDFMLAELIYKRDTKANPTEI